MKGASQFIRNSDWVMMLASVVAGVFFVTMVANASTTISTNISTGGTLSVTGVSTLTYASTTALSTSGNLYVGGFATTTGTTGDFATQGTLGVTGLSTLTGGMLAAASTTVNSTFVTTGTGTFLGNVNVRTAANATSTLTAGCLSTYATSSATQIKLVFNTSATSSDINGGTIQGSVAWEYGACPI